MSFSNHLIFYFQLIRIENDQSKAWRLERQTSSSKRPRGRPRKTPLTLPIITQVAVKPSNNRHQAQSIPSSILSPPASVLSTTQINSLSQNSMSSSAHLPNNSLRHNPLTPPILSTVTETNVIARVPSLFDQVKTTTAESTFAVLSGVQNVLLSPNGDSNNSKPFTFESSSSLASTTNTIGKQV